MDDVTALLRDGARLLTLTGPGGTGKTRLSIEAATELVPDFKAGVFWVPLASLRDHTLVSDTVARTLGAKEGLAEHIGEREMLLLIDNLEQVVAAAPDLATLVEACPNLRVVTTSREVLRVRGEVEYAVPPLAEPEAVELFSARSGMAPDDSVAELCGRLENLPLAVELAAARASVLTPRQILERLSGRLDLLKGGRDAEARQQTLRAAIEWSYDLLSDAEKELFMRLAVFSGGATIEAAENVLDADLDTLQALVDKSLVRHSGDRFWMLETIREFALERLVGSGKAEDLRHRHASFFLSLAEEAEPELRGPEPKGWVDRLGPEADNIRASLAAYQAWAEGEAALRLSGALDEFWCDRAEEAEGRRHLEAALGIGTSPTPARAKALLGAAHLARDSGDPAAGRRFAEDALALAQELGDAPSAASALLWLGACVADEGDFARARQLFEEAGTQHKEVGNHLDALFANRLLAWMHYELGDRGRARALHEANLVRARELGSRDLESSILGALSEYAVNDGRIDDAVALAVEGTRVAVDLGDRQGIAIELCRAANALFATGQPETAVQALASSAAWYREIGSKPLPYLAELTDRLLTSSRSTLGDDIFASAWTAGERLQVEKAAALAIEALELAGAGAPTPNA
jgi:predicted ATPase